MNTHGPLPFVPEYNQLKALVRDKPAHITGRSLEALPFAFNFMRKKRRVNKISLTISHKQRGKEAVHH